VQFEAKVLSKNLWNFLDRQMHRWSPEAWVGNLNCSGVSKSETVHAECQYIKLMILPEMSQGSEGSLSPGGVTVLAFHIERH
jgi:hypothetical protein